MSHLGTTFFQVAVIKKVIRLAKVISPKDIKMNTMIETGEAVVEVTGEDVDKHLYT